MDNFFNDTSQIISDYNGYSIALFGHYLSKIVDESYQLNQNDTETSIIREIWERYQIIDNPFESMKYVLSNDFNSNFQITWLDFCSRNIFNGAFLDMNNDLYYHEILFNSNINFEKFSFKTFLPLRFLLKHLPRLL